MKAEQLLYVHTPAKRNAVLQDAQIRVIRPNWCIQEHTLGIIDSSNSRGQFCYSTKIALPSIQSSYIVRDTQECDACTELSSINSSVGSEKVLHLCIKGKSIVSNAIARTVTWLWDWTSQMLNIIHLTELSSTGENCWETNIFCQDGLSQGNDQWQVIFKSHRLCQSHALWWCVVTHYT